MENFKSCSMRTIVYLVLFLTCVQVCSAGIVPAATTSLADTGSASNPALWYLNGDYTSPADTTFTIGYGKSYNHLTVANGQTFTASYGMITGLNGTGNLLDIKAGAKVVVNESLWIGRSNNIARYSKSNTVRVSGTGARLEVEDDLRVGVGGAWLVTNNTLSVTDGGVVVVDSNKDGQGYLGLSNHWSYGNCWLELDDGIVAIWGDETTAFASGQGILTSIKVWDDSSSSFQRVAGFNEQAVQMNSFYDLLSVEYITDSTQAAALGIDDEFVGFTVLQTVPEPATITLLAISSIAIFRRKK